MYRFDARMLRLREELTARELDAFVVTHPQNRRYLSGFTGSDGALFVTPDGGKLITDFRYLEQAERQSPGFELVEATPLELPETLGELVRQTGVKRVGFESHDVAVADHSDWTRAVDSELVPVKELVEEMRAIKDRGELEAIKRAVAIGDAAMAHVREFIRPGMTEREVAWELEVYVRTHGAEAAGFDIIVASGPNGAMAHATVSDRAIQAGEPIVIDVGARVDGYHSDLTRTLLLGEPDDRFEEIYDVVLRAQKAALEGIRPGMTGREADALARNVIEEAGYGEYFRHGLGHSVGLEIHENPKASTVSEAVLQPGMTLTVEPGIYVTGWGGVRVEDLVVIAGNGVEVLSRAEKRPSMSLP
ncbi:MAG: M24 family metallopeptidase [Anaerolineae bacterium]|nr:M24 family metallopeptidase [Anaerolineae bacterium]NIO00095.1 M24 family metallopeptidase [Anaerolineae bacterium]NIQ80510.1 M24 family metallopeptidase [Anaerolineae bacterium]